MFNFKQETKICNIFDHRSTLSDGNFLVNTCRYRIIDLSQNKTVIIEIVN